MEEVSVRGRTQTRLRSLANPYLLKTIFFSHIVDTRTLVLVIIHINENKYFKFELRKQTIN